VFVKGDFYSKHKVHGFKVKVYDQEVFVERPLKPSRRAWTYSSYDRSLGFTSHATQGGLLANSLYNREMRPVRVEEYIEEMKAGRWHDLLSDPISVTEDGQVLNGQHRLAAALNVDWSEVENDPAFMVVWNVDPKEALHADGSRRTPRDEKTIATKLVGR
jgi:hypothetical protein